MTTTRRGLLGGFAGIAFVGCPLINEARSQGRPPRREVVINGRRVRTIDVHAHCAVPEAMGLMGLKVHRRPWSSRRTASARWMRRASTCRR